MKKEDNWVADVLVVSVVEPALLVYVYWYWVAARPLLLPLVIDTVADPFPTTTPVIVGASGIVNGITLADVVDAALTPASFSALTATVYPVPLVKPVMLKNNAASSKFTYAPPFNEYEYRVTAEPLVFPGEMKTVSWFAAGTTLVIVGGLGTE
jgi:hypothetical protein